jgi:hypothetical protein
LSKWSNKSKTESKNKKKRNEIQNNIVFLKKDLNSFEISFPYNQDILQRTITHKMNFLPQKYFKNKLGLIRKNNTNRKKKSSPS